MWFLLCMLIYWMASIIASSTPEYSFIHMCIHFIHVAGSILFLHLIFDNRFAIPISIVHIKFGCVAAIEIHTDMCVR